MSEQEYGPRRIEDRSDPTDDSIARLLRTAGGRPPIPVADAEIVRAAARAEWQRTVRVERWKKRTIYGGLLAAAAVLLLVVSPSLRQGLWPRATPQVAAASPIATVEAVNGQVTVLRRSGLSDPTALGARDTLAAGDVVATAGAAGRAVLRLADGASVHFDVDTLVRLESRTVLALERGALYVDSDSAGPSLRVESPLGSATDVGTRFEVRLAAGERAMWVRVRDGEVRLERGGKPYRAEAGVELAVLADGSVQRREAAPCGPLWDWTLEILPELEHGSIRDLLEWAAREGCWQLAFADEAAESLAQETVHGSLAGLSLEQALALVLDQASRALTYELDRETEVLRVAASARAGRELPSDTESR